MTTQNATYTKFYTPADAEFLVTLLQQHNIPYTMEHEVNQLDKVYIGDSMDPMFVLKVPANRFNDVNELLAKQAKADMLQPGFESQLQGYSIEELQEILQEPAGWSAYDIQVAKSLLAERNAEVPEATALVAGADAYEPVKVKTIWIRFGYIASIAGLTTIFYLSMAGLFAGLALTQSKKTLPNGSTVKAYTEEDIKHGKNMIFLSLICALVGYLILFSILYS